MPPEAIRDFVKRIGVAKANSVVDVGMFEFSVREVLNRTALRRMAVLRPLKVVIENYPEGQSEELDAVNHPDDPAAGTRKIRFGRELYIERDDFMENPPKKFFRLSPGKEVRLRYAYFITCREVVKDAAGEVVELRCTYDPATHGGNAPDGRKVQGDHALGFGGGLRCRPRCGSTIRCSRSPTRMPATSRPTSIRNSLEVLTDARVEPALAGRNDRRAGAVRAPGLFLPRRGFKAGPARVQPHRRPARHLGQGVRAGRAPEHVWTPCKHAACLVGARLV